MIPFATTEELAAFLQRDVNATTADLALAGASALVRKYCGWPVTETTETLTGIGNGCSVLSLPTLRLTAVESVRLGGTELARAALDVTGVIGAEEYTWTAYGQLVRPTGWPDHAPVAVDCTHGYAPAPDDLKLAALSVAARLFSNPEHLAAEAVGAVNRTYTAAGLLDLEAALLDGYRL